MDAVQTLEGDVRELIRRSGLDPARDEGEVRRRCAAAGIDPDSDHGGRLVGTPAQVVEKAAGLVGLGADRLYLQTMDMTDLDHLDLIAAEVLPHLA